MFIGGVWIPINQSCEYRNLHSRLSTPGLLNQPFERMIGAPLVKIGGQGEFHVLGVSEMSRWA